MMFKDRIEAANLLVAQLQEYKNSDAIVLAIPRGGVPLGYIIAKNLEIPLEVVLSKKIGHPLHKEFAIGAVTLKSQILSESAFDVDSKYIQEETEKIRAALLKKHQDYYGLKSPLELQDKILIIVDDGVATGNTLLSTIEMLHKEKPAKIVVAVPVSSQSALEKMKDHPLINEVICLSAPVNFSAVGQFYKEFAQVDNFVKRNSLEKFGPVRTVKPELVFEIAFEGIAESKRHKSGVALRFPRMSRWRKDKKVEDINTLDDLKEILNNYNRQFISANENF